MIRGFHIWNGKPVAFVSFRIVIVSLVLVISPLFPQQDSAPKPRAEDVASPESIIKAIYEVVSGPAGQKRDWDRFRTLFAPGGRAISTGAQPDGTQVARVWDVEGYIGLATKSFETRGFFERE